MCSYLLSGGHNMLVQNMSHLVSCAVAPAANSMSESFEIMIKGQTDPVEPRASARHRVHGHGRLFGSRL